MIRTAILLMLEGFLASTTVWAGVNEWTTLGPEGGSVRRLIVDPQNPAMLYAATRVGLFKSTDGGGNWTNIGLNGWDVDRLVIDRQNPSTLYAVTYGHPV